jgi:hypothetical protein
MPQLPGGVLADFIAQHYLWRELRTRRLSPFPSLPGGAHGFGPELDRHGFSSTSRVFVKSSPGWWTLSRPDAQRSGGLREPQPGVEVKPQASRCRSRAPSRSRWAPHHQARENDTAWASYRVVPDGSNRSSETFPFRAEVAAPRFDDPLALLPQGDLPAGVDLERIRRLDRLRFEALTRPELVSEAEARDPARGGRGRAR